MIFYKQSSLLIWPIVSTRLDITFVIMKLARFIKDSGP